MGCEFEVLLPPGEEGGPEAATRALERVRTLEDRLSVYRPDSEVSRLNTSGGLGPREVSNDLLEILVLSGRLARETDGAFDPASGAVNRAWGFDAGTRSVPSETRLKEALARSGLRFVRIDPETRTVELVHAGVELNFGAIGKGFALDHVAHALRKSGDRIVALLHGGQSSILSIGYPRGDARGWSIGLSDPQDRDQLVARINLRDQGLATSTNANRYFEKGGRKWGHIIDPRTGFPSENTGAVTAVAPTAAEADALSTAFFILGPEFADRYAATHPGVGAAFVPENPATTPIRLAGSLEIEVRPDLEARRQDSAV
jgi:thiamine biosynthesis lipoprotein